MFSVDTNLHRSSLICIYARMMFLICGFDIHIICMQCHVNALYVLLYAFVKKISYMHIVYIIELT